MFATDEIARHVMSAQDRVAELEPITSRHPGFDLSAAYDVARYIHDHRVAEGARPVGRKIGFTNAEMWRLLGVQEPVWGYVYRHTLTECSDGMVKLDLDRFRQARIEPEIVVHFRNTPPPGASEASDILSCIDWIAHGIEIVQSHFPGWKFQAPDTVADAALHGALIVGRPVPLGQLGHNLLSTLAEFSVDLSCDEALLETGYGRNVLGSPISAVSYLIRSIAAQNQASSIQAPPIQAGELITTGTLTKAYPVRPGESWRTRLHGIDLPGLEVRFVSSERGDTG